MMLPPPQHSADTDAVLRDVLGKSEDEIARLRLNGVV
jgi:crotonobetainyl-CoA:carnitine CoA-transferase CaiB-like acyl-CoA transferase